MIIVSCYESETDVILSETKQQNIVFGKRDVDTIRTLLLRSADTFTTNVQDSYLSASVALNSTATGSVRSYDVKYIQSTDTCSVLLNQAGGSGVLSSDSRLVTADHVIFPRMYYLYKPQDPCSIDVSFERISVNYFSQNPEDGIDFNDPFNSPITEENHNYKIQTSNIETSEENPMLANRLFAMSLEQFATFDNIDRTQLYSWKFKIDDEGIHRDAENLPYRPFTVPNLQDDGTWALTGSDVAVLVACGPRFPGKEKLVSGPFDLKKPAVFFNQVPMIQLENEYLIDEESKKVWLLHVNNWPYTDTNGSDTNLISNPGALDITRAGFFDSAVEKCDTLIHGANIRKHDRNSIPASLDSKKGSSGGVALIRGTGDLIEGVSQEFFGWGVNAATNIDYIREPGTPGGTMCSDISGFWCRGLNRDYPMPPTNVQARYAGDAKTYANYFASFNENIVSWTRRDTGIDPFNPIVFKPDTTIPVPELCLIKKDGYCLSFYEAQKNNLIGDFSDMTVVDYYSWDSSFQEDESTTFPTAEAKPYPEPSTLKMANCNNHFLGLNEPGIAIGIMGNSENNSSQNPGRIENFHLICAPWSNAPYTDNWRFLFTTGRSIQKKSSTAMIIFPYVERFKYALTRFLELRKDENIYIRPISLKMCPPNYALSSLGTIQKNVNGENEVIGIKSITCTKINSSLDPSLNTPPFLTFPLGYQETDPKYELFGRFKMSGKHFSLNQQIGTIFNSGSDQEIEYPCEHPTDVVGGLIFPDKENNRINPLTKFAVACIKNPGGF